MGELWDILDLNGNKTGKFHERGKPMNKGEGHLVVHIWILNAAGEFLISKRTPGITGWANMWQTTGGSAVAGDDSLKTALKETSEELGVSLDAKNGQLFAHYKRLHTNDEGFAFYDVWLFKQEVALSSVKFQPEETCDAMWANKEKITDMISRNEFISDEWYPYLEELFRYCGL